MKRFIPAKFHGATDIATSGLFLAGPEIFQIKWDRGSALPAKVFGAIVLVNAACTDFGPSKGLEYGGLRLWSLRTHLILDVLGGIIIATGPWITGSRRKGWNYWMPHMFALSTETFFALFTKFPEEQKS